MAKISYSVILLVIIQQFVFGQNTTNIVVCQNLNIFYNSVSSLKSVDPRTFNSAGVELYSWSENRKIDSLYIKGEDFQMSKDTVTFLVRVPNRFFKQDIKLTIQPYYYKSQISVKGGRAIFLKVLEVPITQIKLKMKSDPKGATVYLVPKIYWEKDVRLRNYDLNQLGRYIVSGGPTIVTATVQEYVYEAIFSYQNKFSKVECSPTHLTAIDSVYVQIK